MQGIYIKRSAIEDQVKKVIAEHLDVKEEAIVPNANFVQDLGADALDTVELVTAFEEEFAIQISDEDAAKLTTVQAVIDYINKNNT
ncbi:hypothetical protein ASPSYDRAFT_137778 [Aspergillus sydowii CBS 593.65]|uniref:Acyl carrier protein n=1 Tax=Aspergillus sydowii CBS 593.65 TaxID=1036612 RepID=A0A1L9SZ80_9EURO|nr:uncharacterized protein ASPSYDRAFT_137778 [Aspergillus sydowii CBS 593.65]OJJ52479.1 hypothetical protein ASPSYDRAFT_137778 [Aspergillus sydowii CBS 593.65]